MKSGKITVPAQCTSEWVLYIRAEVIIMQPCLLHTLSLSLMCTVVDNTQLENLCVNMTLACWCHMLRKQLCTHNCCSVLLILIVHYACGSSAAIRTTWRHTLGGTPFHFCAILQAHVKIELGYCAFFFHRAIVQYYGIVCCAILSLLSWKSGIYSHGSGGRISYIATYAYCLPSSSVKQSLLCLLTHRPLLFGDKTECFWSPTIMIGYFYDGNCDFDWSPKICNIFLNTLAVFLMVMG